MPPKKQTKKTTTIQPLNLSNIKLGDKNNATLLKIMQKLNKTIETVTKAQDEFNDNFESLQNYKEDEMNNMIQELSLKTEECNNNLSEIETSYNNKLVELKRNYDEYKYNLECEHAKKQSDLDLEFKNYSIEKATQFLTENEFSIIPIREYEKLTTSVKNAEKDMEEYKKKVDADMHKELNARLKTQKLEHDVASSQMKARIDNQERELKQLNDLIEKLREEIREQRNLTKEVAQASQKSIMQTIGGKN